MSKRPLASASDSAQPLRRPRRTGGNGTGEGISSSSSSTPAQDCITDVTDPAADFKSKLLLAIFSKRLAKHEIHAVEYIVSLTSLPPSTPSNGDYVSFVKRIHPSATTESMNKAWDKIKLYFDTKALDPEINDRIDVAAFRTALHESPTVNLDTATMPESEYTTSSSRSRPLSGRSWNSSSGSGGCSNLTQAQITALQKTFHDNFARFNGAPWLLPSKTVFDERLHGSIKHLSMESAIHSFIVEDTDPIIRLFEDAADQEEVKRVMSRGRGLPALSSAESTFLKQYNKAPGDLEEYLITHGWRNVGDDLHNKPSDDFRKVTHVCFKPGEVPSDASRRRRNKPRTRETHQHTGHKTDGMVVVPARSLEVCYVETAKKDGGSNTTKSLDDTEKLLKFMKDAHDTIRERATRDIREQLVTFGLRISGPTLTIFTLRQLPVAEESVSFPEIWLDNDTETITTVIARVLILRKAPSRDSGIGCYFNIIES
ncbi:hypothetical protein BGX34_000159 [Mortierella sp. NVP85]|nr:hypothetical protein BGX34_000159 [Mortierella sp. NVP85]